MTADGEPPPGSALDAVRAVERTLAARVDQRAAAERARAKALTAAEALLAHAREQAAAEAAAVRAQRFEEAERQAAATLAAAHTRAEREASRLTARRAELAEQLLALVLPALDEPGAPADGRRG